MTNEHGLEPTPRINGAYLGVTERDFEIVQTNSISFDGFNAFELRLMRTGGGYELVYFGQYYACEAAQAGFLAAVKLIGGK